MFESIRNFLPCEHDEPPDHHSDHSVADDAPVDEVQSVRSPYLLCEYEPSIPGIGNPLWDALYSRFTPQVCINMSSLAFTTSTAFASDWAESRSAIRTS